MKKTNNHSILQRLTPDVKEIMLGSQLQQFRSFANEKGQWAYELRFFPGPKKHSLLARSSLGSLLSLFQAGDSESRQGLHLGLKARVDPIQLYVRAHLLNQRLVREVEVEAGFESGLRKVCFYFQSGKLEIQQEGTSSEVRILVQAEGKKDFSRSIVLASLDAPSSENQSKDDPKEKTGSQAEEGVSEKQLKKRQKLIESVERDLENSKSGLEKLNNICRLLEQEPLAWGQRHLWEDSVFAQLEEFSKRHQWPLFMEETRASAQEQIFSLRKRYQRKIEGAEKRLAEVQKQDPRPASVAQSHQPRKASNSGKSAGRRVFHSSGVMALIGKKQKENADLYRAAGSRDFWFHVKGQGGAHVWVPRGQKGVSGKEKLSGELSRWAAQLAVYNSKARSSEYGFVDMTEKRHLKSVKGQEGVLIIRSSETLSVELDKSFYDWLSSDASSEGKKG